LHAQENTAPTATAAAGRPAPKTRRACRISQAEGFRAAFSVSLFQSATRRNSRTPESTHICKLGIVSTKFHIHGFFHKLANITKLFIFNQ
jgi:hypothetical protein